MAHSLSERRAKQEFLGNRAMEPWDGAKLQHPEAFINKTHEDLVFIGGRRIFAIL